MKEKFEFVLLPPDFFQMTMRNKLSDSRTYIQEISEVVNTIKKPQDKILVKYRTANHKFLFPYNNATRVGYGNLLDFCSPQTIVIGMPNSGTWECLLNGVRYYSFLNIKQIEKNGYFDPNAIERLLNILYIAQDKHELLVNIVNNRIFKPGKSKKDLVHRNGISLSETISLILKNQKRPSHET